MSTKNINITAYLLLYTCISIRDYEIYDNNSNMSKIKIIQIYCYNYVIHPGGLEKIAQTLNHELNQKHDIQVLDITSDIRAK